VYSREMGRSELIVLIFFICVICTYSVKLNVWFIMDYYKTNAILLAPEVIWNDLRDSDLIGRHLANTFTVSEGQCSLDGVKSMMKSFTADNVNDIHAFIGPICSYACDLTGIISSVYSIPQVCGFYNFDP